jgi:predicted dinucleotide-binding enzyme
VLDLLPWLRRVGQHVISIAHMEASGAQIHVAVLGQGLMGSAFTSRVRSCDGIRVHSASNRPSSSDLTNADKSDLQTVSFAEAISRSSLVVLAVPAGAHESVAQLYGKRLAGKVLVDLSNGSAANKEPYARLVKLLPDTSVVKVSSSSNVRCLLVTKFLSVSHFCVAQLRADALYSQRNCDLLLLFLCRPSTPSMRTACTVTATPSP